MELDLKRIHQVLTVVRTGSFSRAAQELHITQPALSRSIAALEARYAIRIFERGRKGAILTTVGRAFVDEAEGLLGRARLMEHNFRLFSSGNAGKVAFGMGPLIASMVLPSLSQSFLEKRPYLHLVVVTKSANALYQELQSDSIEILFCGGDQLRDRPDLVFETVGQIDVSIIVRSEHPLANEQTVNPDDIARYPLLSGAEMQIMKRAGGAGSLVCDNYHILRETVLHTDAVWVSSPQFVIDDMKKGRLKALTLGGEILQSKVNIFLVAKEFAHLSPAAQAIRDFVKSYFHQLTIDTLTTQ